VNKPRQASAVAPSNIALVKYWGKRDLDLNLPATGSISVTLDKLTSRTHVTFDEDLDADRVTLDGRPLEAEARRVVRFLDLVRATYGEHAYARVDSANDFPTGAGLASSASGFAALALACDAALGLGLTRDELSVLARRGSGSAARSFIDGFAEMDAGTATDGSDAYAVDLAPPEHLDLRILVAVTTRRKKAIGSTEGMRLTQATSPFYEAWLDATRADLASMRTAIADADVARVGALAEANCLCMHATMLSTQPALLYWNAATVDVMHAVHALRAEGYGAWFTIDAGPQVKVLCRPSEAPAIEKRLAAIPGVQDVIAAAPGRGARLLPGESGGSL